MNTPELNAALIENLPDIELTQRHLDALEEAVNTTVNEMTVEWMETHGWRGEASDEGFWMAAPEWNDPACVDTDVAFSIEWIDFDETDDIEPNMISRLCQNGYGSTGLEFVRPFKGGKWNAVLPELVDLLQDTGFVLYGKQLILPLRVDRDVLARGAADNDLAEGLRQYRDALDRLGACRPALDKVVARLRPELED